MQANQTARLRNFADNKCYNPAPASAQPAALTSAIAHMIAITVNASEIMPNAKPPPASPLPPPVSFHCFIPLAPKLTANIANIIDA